MNIRLYSNEHQPISHFLTDYLSLSFEFSHKNTKLAMLAKSDIIARLTGLGQTSVRCEKWFQNSQMKLAVAELQIYTFNVNDISLQ